MIDQYIRQYGKRLYGLCLSLCANTFEADDLYQDTWLRVVKSISQFDPSREFEPWLTRICINTYRNTLRRIARSPLLNFRSNEEKDALLQSVPAPANPDYGPLYEAIDGLPEKLRLAVILYYFEESEKEYYSKESHRVCINNMLFKKFKKKFKKYGAKRVPKN